jgi:hypothetical protein
MRSGRRAVQADNPESGTMWTFIQSSFTNGMATTCHASSYVT